MSTPDSRARTSKQRYLRFVQDYQKGLLDDQVDAAKGLKPVEKPSAWLGV